MNPTFNRCSILGAYCVTIAVTLACARRNEDTVSRARVTLQGSGATFPAPLYSRWFKEFSGQQARIRVNYQATGSGAGVKAFVAGQTDFGASDAAMSDEEIASAKGNVLMLPVTAGGIVLAYRLDGVSELALTRDAYARVFLGQVTHWTDDRIARSNPGVRLPDQKIAPVYRSDGSGTTFVFTTHLSAINGEWAKGPGSGTAVEFPAGVGGRKNDGVAALIAQTPGAIGYVEYAYAVASGLPMVSLENASGRFVRPSLDSFSAALASVRLPDNLRAWIPDPPGEAAYPIVTYTWLLTRQAYADPERAAAIEQLLEWCLGEGQLLARELHYVPLPANVVNEVRAKASTIR